MTARLRVGKSTYSCAVSVVTHDKTLTPDAVREWVSVHEEVEHTTIEINHCPDDHAGEPALKRATAG